MLAASLLSGDLPSIIRFHMPLHMPSVLETSFDVHLADGGVITSLLQNEIRWAAQHLNKIKSGLLAVTSIFRSLRFQDMGSGA